MNSLCRGSLHVRRFVVSFTNIKTLAEVNGNGLLYLNVTTSLQAACFGLSRQQPLNSQFTVSASFPLFQSSKSFCCPSTLCETWIERNSLITGQRLSKFEYSTSTEQNQKPVDQGQGNSKHNSTTGSHNRGDQYINNKKTADSDDTSSTRRSSESESLFGSTNKIPENGEKRGLLQRFKQTYQEYGKLLIVVHVVTSAMWFAGFYCAAAGGIDVVALLKWLGAGDTIIRPFTLPGVGNTAVMYLLYKLATPVRYPVSIFGTQFLGRLLRRRGILPPIPEKNTLRSLLKDSRKQIKQQGLTGSQGHRKK